MKRKATIVYNPEYTPDGTRDRLRWIKHASDGLRVVGAAHELARLGHTGWHLDPLGDGDTVHGAVIQLPARSGMARYVPAVSDPWNDDCYLVDFHDHYDAPGCDADEARRDCARAADGMAERYAERERDYATKENAKARIEEARERIASERKEAHALAAEMRSFASWRNVSAPAICKELHRCMAQHRATVRTAIKEIRTLTDNPYAWLEGAL